MENPEQKSGDHAPLLFNTEVPHMISRFLQGIFHWTFPVIHPVAFQWAEKMATLCYTRNTLYSSAESESPENISVGEGRVR